MGLDKKREGNEVEKYTTSIPLKSTPFILYTQFFFWWERALNL